ncbi:MAG: DUF1674 domain-containing protein [Ostreibacterium sp.]
MVKPVKIDFNSNQKVTELSEQSMEKTDNIGNIIIHNRKAIDEKIASMPNEYGGRSTDQGLEATRYGDWESKGRCIDF